MFYRYVLAPLLFLLPAETAHRLAFRSLQLLSALGHLDRVFARALAPTDASLRVHALGLSFASPIGLAAGFDKDALAYDALLGLGFGFVEIGTVTAEAQPGNPQPRMFRLKTDRALINRLGFNNGGASEAERRLAGRERSHGVVGVNIGKTKRVEEEGAIADFEASTRLLAPHADYFVINVSSPNTPGLRDLQATDKLRPLVRAVQAAIEEACRGQKKPALLVKIAPDLADEDIDHIADLAIELGLAGLIATNTTLARSPLRTPAPTVKRMGAGGLSGAPLAARSLAVLRRLRMRVDDRLTLISVGGVESAEDAWKRIKAGATLVQLYTGFVYGGPLLPSRIARDLAKLARAEGYDSVEKAIGVEAHRVSLAAPPPS